MRVVIHGTSMAEIPHCLNVMLRLLMLLMRQYMPYIPSIAICVFEACIFVYKWIGIDVEILCAIQWNVKSFRFVCSRFYYKMTWVEHYSMHLALVVLWWHTLDKYLIAAVRASEHTKHKKRSVQVLSCQFCTHKHVHVDTHKYSFILFYSIFLFDQSHWSKTSGTSWTKWQ